MTKKSEKSKNDNDPKMKGRKAKLNEDNLEESESPITKKRQRKNKIEATNDDQEQSNVILVEDKEVSMASLSAVVLQNTENSRSTESEIENEIPIELDNDTPNEAIIFTPVETMALVIAHEETSLNNTNETYTADTTATTTITNNTLTIPMTSAPNQNIKTSRSKKVKNKAGQLSEWRYHYLALLEYHTEYGTCNVPPLHIYECELPNMGDDGGSYHYKDNLGKWLHIQRQAKVNHHGINKITPDQVAQLQLLVDEGKLSWTIEKQVLIPKKNVIVEWPRHYFALLEYCKEFGSCNIPKRCSYECDLQGLGDEGGVYHYKGNLGSWLDYQRKAKKGKNGNKISPERESQLQQLVDEGKLSWNPPNVFIEAKQKKGLIDWPRHFGALLQYYKEFNTCNIPTTHVYECDLPNMGENGNDFHYKGNLGKWLDNQRQGKKKLGGFKLTPDRQAQLQVLVDEGKLNWEMKTS